MELDTEEKRRIFSPREFPTFEPLITHPNSISGAQQKLDKIKEKGGFLFKRNGKIFFFRENEISLSDPHLTSKDNGYAVYLIPEKFRI